MMAFLEDGQLRQDLVEQRDDAGGKPTALVSAKQRAGCVCAMVTWLAQHLVHGMGICSAGLFRMFEYLLDYRVFAVPG
jgi:hypothetical protein